jgi:hypothetical protein
VNPALTQYVSYLPAASAPAGPGERK